LAIGRPEGVCRQSLERQLLRIDQASAYQPVSGRHDQLPLILKQDSALNQAIMGKWKSAKRCVDLAHCNRRKLVQHVFMLSVESLIQIRDAAAVPESALHQNARQAQAAR
jgi:hypothetical protein